MLHEWTTKNLEHRYSRPDETRNLDWLRQAQRDYLHAKLPELGLWHIPPDEPIGYPPTRCTVKPNPSFGVHPECKAVTESKFQSWINGEYEPSGL